MESSIERFAYRPLRIAPRIAPLISALGVSFFLQNSVLLLGGAQIRIYETYDLDHGVLFEKGLHVGPLNISLARLIVVGSAPPSPMGLDPHGRRATKLGKAMRATSFDREAAADDGHRRRPRDHGDVLDRLARSRARPASWSASSSSRSTTSWASAPGLKAFTAAVVGGIGSIPGAMLGGLLIGVAESFATGYISSTYKDAIVFALLIVIMLVRPQGLLGKPEIKKVSRVPQVGKDEWVAQADGADRDAPAAGEARMPARLATAFPSLFASLPRSSRWR